MEARRKNPLLMALIDPEKYSPNTAGDIASALDDSPFYAILVGGSTAIWQSKVDDIILAMREKTAKPIIIFPGSISNLSPKADAVLFISLLNSDSTFYLIDQQFLAAPIVKGMSLEAIPTAYIIVGEGATAGFVGRARPIPEDRPELAAIYALTAGYLGFRLLYLEAGSGAKRPISPSFVETVKKASPVPVMAGGGIRTAAQVHELFDHGADIVVIGNVLENPSDAAELIRGLKALRA
jgi:phosphoglycerol geranylgeranyltransferase